MGVRLQRWRLLRAYSKVFLVRTRKSVGFTPLLAVYESAQDDWLLEFDDCAIV